MKYSDATPPPPLPPSLSVLQRQSDLSGLNPPQQEAVCHHEGPILVLAGAGSGKTRVLTRRVAHLILYHGVRPDSILAVTFTNKATEEMRERLQSMLGNRAFRLWVATFHSAGLRILRAHSEHLGYRNNFVVYDDQDTRNVIKGVLKELSIPEKKVSVAEIRQIIDRAKNAAVEPEQLKEFLTSGARYGHRDPVIDLHVEIYRAYQQALKVSNAMDFGDLLMNAVKVLKQVPGVLAQYRRQLSYLLVDEFQDTNMVQYELVRLLVEPKNNLLVVGDDDQSIYAFRGATVKNILEFGRDFPAAKVVKLEQNYRSSACILDAANSVIEKNKTRQPKRLWTEAPRGELITPFVGEDEQEEADFIAREIRRRSEGGVSLNDIAIFYRVNAQSRALEDALMRYGIPYRIFGGLKFYDRKEVKDIIAYLRMLVSDTDAQAFLRCVNTPARGIGTQTIQQILNEAKQQEIPIFAAARTVAARNKNVNLFVTLIDGLRHEAQSMQLGALVREVTTRSKYRAALEESKDPVSQSRLENLAELEALGRSFESAAEGKLAVLGEFLDKVSLSSGQELPVEEQRDRERQAAQQEIAPVVSLMTLHLAKGLEFPVVFISGLEEGLLPHYRSVQEGEIDEERRLCYVGMTRAMSALYLTRCHTRGMFLAGGQGGGYFRVVSRFVYDIPEGCMTDDAARFFGSGFDSEEYYFDEPDFEKDLIVEESGFRQEEKPAPRTGKMPAGRGTGQVRAADDLLSDEEE